MEPVISIRDLVVRQGETFTLSVPRLDLLPRRIYTLTGPNGAGKSTLLKTMALLILPQSGKVRFAAAGLLSLTQQRQKVTLVEQSPYLLAGNVSDNLAFGLKFRGINRKEQRVRITAALAMVGLDGFEKRKANELSGGEVQRVALARALVLAPEVLLLDELTANIDRASLHDFEALLCRLPEQGVTVVFATHDLLLAKRLGGEMLCLDKGCLLDGPHPSLVNNSAREQRYG